MKVREAMIVAGGAGTRLRPLTETTPKPLLEFCGEPFLLGMVRRLASVGIEHVLLVVGADTRPFEVFAPATAGLGVTIDVVAEPEPLDTAGGVRSALDRVSGTFLVLNGDVLTDLDVVALVDHHRARRAAVTIALTRVEDTSTFGVCMLEGSQVVGFVEKPGAGSLPGHDTVNAGTYVVEPTALVEFAQGPLSFERTVFPRLVDTGARVEGFVTDAVWADLGTPERWLAGHRLVLEGAMQWPGAWAADGITVRSGATVDPTAVLVAPTLVCEGSAVGAGATVGPGVVVGPGATVGPGVVLTGSVVGSGAWVAASATRLLAGPGVRIESGARIGRDVVLGDHVVVTPGESLADGSRRPEKP